MEHIAECRQMQVDEIMALQALIEPDKFVISKECQFAELQAKLEQYACGSGDQDLCLSIVRHPPLSVYILLQVDDNNAILYPEDSSMQFTAGVLLNVTLPRSYLSSDTSFLPATPDFEFLRVLVTDKEALCSADKPLESLAWLDKATLLEAMSKYATQELLPYPCVYELTETWLTDHLFEYLRLQPGVIVTK